MKTLDLGFPGHRVAAESVRLVAAILVAVLYLAVARPVAHAQPPSRRPVIAILEPASASAPPGGVRHFKEALRALGWVEGQTVRFEVRYGEWQSNRLAEAARELVGLKPDVVYTHSDSGLTAARQATTSIPIVVGVAADLLASGAVRSLAQPGLLIRADRVIE